NHSARPPKTQPQMPPVSPERPTVSPARLRRLQRPSNRLSSAGEGRSKYIAQKPQVEKSKKRKKTQKPYFIH
ncbi:MAG: hypothetical protein AB3N12_11550, partial [Ruegeria sp.]